MKNAVVTALIGALLGLSLSYIGFSSWDEVHHMFTLQSFRLIGAFMLAVAILFFAWQLVHRKTGVTWPPRKVHPGTVAGGVLFGIGWALSGACPSIALVQLGEAQWGALWTLLGIFLGNLLYSVVHERYFRWSARNCADD